MRGLAGWRRRYWMMIRWYWWIINVGECKCPLVHKYQYWYYDLDNIYWYINVGSCNFQIYPEMSIPTGYISFPIFRLDHCRRQPRGWKKKGSQLEDCVFGGFRKSISDDSGWLLMISDDFGWLRMTSDVFWWFLHQTLARMQISGFNSPAKASVKGPMASESFSDICGQVVMASQNDFLICEQPIVDQTGLKD